MVHLHSLPSFVVEPHTFRSFRGAYRLFRMQDQVGASTKLKQGTMFRYSVAMSPFLGTSNVPYDFELEDLDLDALQDSAVITLQTKQVVVMRQGNAEWLRDAIIRRGRFSSHVDEHSSCEIPVEVMCRLTHLFEHEIDTTRRLHAHRRNLLELGVGPQTISDYFAEVTKAVATVVMALAILFLQGCTSGTRIERNCVRGGVSEKFTRLHPFSPFLVLLHPLRA